MSQIEASPDNAVSSSEGHRRWVRVSHWVIVASFLTLAFTGILILAVHPRLYWGEVGNDLTPALLEIPISGNHLALTQYSIRTDGAAACISWPRGFSS